MRNKILSLEIFLCRPGDGSSDLFCMKISFFLKFSELYKVQTVDVSMLEHYTKIKINSVSASRALHVSPVLTVSCQFNLIQRFNSGNLYRWCDIR